MELISKWLTERGIGHKTMKGETVDWVDIPVGWEDNLTFKQNPDYTIEILENNVIEFHVWKNNDYTTIGTADLADPDCFKLFQPLVDKYGYEKSEDFSL